MLPPKIPSVCESKGPHEGKPKYCNGCSRVYCDLCYERQELHDNPDHRLNEHEKTDLGIAKILLSLSGIGGSVEERENQHQININSKWFGAAIDIATDDPGSKTYFHDFGGFVKLLDESPLFPHEQFPSLVSFVGETGAGKSTVIKAILKLSSERLQPNGSLEDVLSPVIGASSEQNVPTSGDVHLFSDPESLNTNRPIFYADCEGLRGGEYLPTASRYLEKLGAIDLKELVHKRRVMSPAITRRWAVRELYPRILFPFSDVICYVTKNARVFEHVVEMLLLWAHKAIDKSTNQPMLPHALLVLNAITVEAGEHEVYWWDASEVTSRFLETYRDLVKAATSPIGKLALTWKRRGRDIQSLRQLISCYFRDFEIICIPEIKSSQQSRTMKQYRRLSDGIASASAGCLESRQNLGFLMSAETLERYLDMAFDHFTATPNKPFNFLSAALLRTPVTQTLQDHICKLAVHFMGLFPGKNGRTLFEKIAPWVACCIFLNSHRFQLPSNGHLKYGECLFVRTTHLYKSCHALLQGQRLAHVTNSQLMQDVADSMINRYRFYCEGAQRVFYDTYWPCEEVDKRGNRCVNIKSRHHTKGHQNGDGKIFAAKNPEFKLAFRSSFETDIDKKQANEEFSAALLAGLQRHIQDYKRLLDGIEMKEAVAKIHLSVLEAFCKEGAMKKLVSHTTCFSCLTSSPAHKLRCGHIICQLCLQEYGSYDESHHLCCLVIKKCPLCGYQGQPLQFEMKPPTAGVRILCLDGGGIRSIVQLEILKRLEQMTLGIPMHNFFDLILGTSGGGIVAAGIGLKRLGTSTCIEQFTGFAIRAFKKRLATGIPLIGKLVVARHHSFYKSEGLENVLKDTFGEDCIFGAGVGKSVLPSLKVGVIAVSSTRQTFLLTNYNRQPPEKRLVKGANTKDENDDSDDDVDDNGSIKDEAEDSAVHEETAYQKRPEDGSETGLEIEEDSEEEPEYKPVSETGESVSENIPDTASGEETTENSQESPSELLATRSSYVFLRGENQEMEFKLWEAVRATTAAPGYFKSFCHPATKYTFYDGAITCNNPVFVADEERKILWPDYSKQDPDILLSIGTGAGPTLDYTTDPTPEPKNGIRSYIKKMVKLGSGAVKEDMDCEISWKKFIQGLGAHDATDRLKRYQRLNLQLKPVPELDDVSQIKALQQKTQNFLNQNHALVTQIANTLIGALFYFELQTACPESGKSAKQISNLVCTGTIKCRLDKNNAGSYALATMLEGYENQKKCSFLIGERGGIERKGLELISKPDSPTKGKVLREVTFTLKYADEDKEMCIFLSLWHDTSKAVNISGFPRQLFSEAKSICKRGSPTRENTFC